MRKSYCKTFLATLPEELDRAVSLFLATLPAGYTLDGVCYAMTSPYIQGRARPALYFSLVLFYSVEGTL